MGAGFWFQGFGLRILGSGFWVQDGGRSGADLWIRDLGLDVSVASGGSLRKGRPRIQQTCASGGRREFSAEAGARCAVRCRTGVMTQLVDQAFLYRVVKTGFKTAYYRHTHFTRGRRRGGILGAWGERVRTVGKSAGLRQW